MLNPDPVRIFISSPGDVALERSLSEGVIRRLQGEFGNRTRIEPIFWEHEPLVATNSFQGQLVRPSDVEIVVCILWSRLGTRLPEEFHRADGSRYQSGTEFEFEDALTGYRAHGRPALLIYRKTAEAMVGLSDVSLLAKLEQKKALDDFLHRWFHKSSDGALTAAFHSFETPARFEKLLEVHLRKLIQELLPQRGPGTVTHRPTRTWMKGSPFRGLEFFDFEHAPIFSGRTQATSDVLDALRLQKSEERSFVLITGMSGCGKSSLVRAGVLPLLVQPGVIEEVGSWRRSIFRPTESTGNLWHGLSASLLRVGALPELGEGGVTIGQLAATLKDNPGNVSTLVSTGLLAASAVGGAHPPVNLVLVVDPFEEILSRERFDSADRSGFVAVLDALARSSNTWVIATLRSDFYHKCEQFPSLVALMSGAGTYHLMPPSTAETAQLIRQPAWAGGLQFEENASWERLDDVLRDAATGNEQALPLLEFTLEELYKLRTDEDLLTFEAYQVIGGIEGSIAQRAEEVYATLPSAAQMSLPAVIHALVGLSSGEEFAIRRQARLDIWDADSRLLLDKFIDARLFVTDQTDDGEAVVSLAHEALLRHWPRLTSWVRENQERLRARDRIEGAALRWEQEARSPEFLLRDGKPLAEGLDLLNWKEARLGPIDAEFVRSSLRYIGRARRRRLVSLVAAVVLLGVFGGFSYWQWRMAEERARIIEENAIASRAESVLDMLSTRPVQGLQLAVEVSGASFRRFGRLPQAVRNSLKAALDVAREANVLSGHGATVRSVAFDPIGRWLVSVSADGSLCFWNRKGQLLRQFVPKPADQTSPFAPLRAVAVSSRGDLIATGGDAGLQLWDQNGRLLISQPVGHDRAVNAVASMRNLIASAGEDGTVRLWDLQGHAIGEPLQGHSGAVLGVAFDPQRERLASAGEDGTIRLWDLNGRPLASWHAHDGGVTAIAFDPNGGLLASAGRDGTATIWYPDQHIPHAVLSGHQGAVTSIAFSPTGRFLATGGLDHTVRVWTVQGIPALVLRGHEESVRAVAFDPSGEVLASASGPSLSTAQAHRDNTIRLWDVGPMPLSVLSPGLEFSDIAYSPDGTQIATVARRDDFPPQSDLVLRNIQGKPVTPSLKGHRGSIAAVVFSKDGKLLATGGQDGTVRLWDSRGRPASLPLVGTNVAATALAFGESNLLAIGWADGTIQIWDTNREHGYLPWRGHIKQVNALVFSPDGTLLASASDDNSVRLWDRDGRSVREPFLGHTDGATSLAFNPNGRSLASASRDGTIRLWDVFGRAVRRPFEGHSGVVTGVAFSPDGSLIGSVGEDGTLRLWSLDGKPIGYPTVGHAHYVEALAFSPSGDALLTAGRDGLIRTWPAQDNLWLTDACQRLRWHPLMTESRRTHGELAGVCDARPARKIDKKDDLVAAAAKGDVFRLRTLLRAGDSVKSSRAREEIALLAGARMGQAEAVQILLAHGAEVRITNKEGDTPLHLAARSGNTEMIRLLVEAGAGLEARGRHGDTPLLVATRAGWIEVVGLLLRLGADARVRDARGKSAVAVASLGDDHGDLTNRLLEAGALPDGIKVTGATDDYLSTASTELPPGLDRDSETCVTQQGQGRPADLVARCFQEAAGRGSSYAQLQLGRAFEFGKGVSQNFVQAAKWYRLAASAREKAAIRNLSRCYRTGRGVAQDPQKALTLLRQAAELSDLRAQTDLGICLQDPECTPSVDFWAAAYWLSRAAERGFESAQVELGKLYEQGLGVPQSRSTAAQWYRRAADQRSAAAMYYLGGLYESDFSFPSASVEALMWYRSAAKQGSAEAEHKLGFLYEKGILVKASDIEAMEWYRKAAAAGNCASQVALGRLLEAHGESDAATQLYKSAADAGSTWAGRKLDKSLWATVPREELYSPCR